MCTLADMQFDIYHATIDSDRGLASQEYYIRCARTWGRAAPRLAVGSRNSPTFSPATCLLQPGPLLLHVHVQAAHRRRDV